MATAVCPRAAGGRPRSPRRAAGGRRAAPGSASGPLRVLGHRRRRWTAGVGPRRRLHPRGPARRCGSSDRASAARQQRHVGGLRRAARSGRARAGRPRVGRQPAGRRGRPRLPADRVELGSRRAACRAEHRQLSPRSHQLGHLLGGFCRSGCRPRGAGRGSGEGRGLGHPGPGSPQADLQRHGLGGRGVRARGPPSHRPRREPRLRVTGGRRSPGAVERVQGRGRGRSSGNRSRSTTTGSCSSGRPRRFRWPGRCSRTC